MFIFILDCSNGTVKKKYITERQAKNEDFIDWILYNKMGYNDSTCNYMIAKTDEIIDMDEEIYNGME